MDLPLCGDVFDSIMVVIDKSTRMTQLIGCSKTISTAQAAKLHVKEVVRLHGILRFIYTDWGT